MKIKLNKTGILSAVFVLLMSVASVQAQTGAAVSSSGDGGTFSSANSGTISGVAPASSGTSSALFASPSSSNFSGGSVSSGSALLTSPDSFDSFITNSSAAIGTAASPTTTSSPNFDSFITTSTSGTGSTNGINAVRTTTTQTNVGGSIYVPYEGPVFTGPGLEAGALLAENLLDDNVSKERDVKELIIGWVNFLLAVVAVLAVVALIWAGVLYVTSGGDDGAIEKAKKIVIWVVIGIILILGAYAIVNTVMVAAF